MALSIATVLAIAATSSEVRAEEIDLAEALSRAKAHPDLALSDSDVAAAEAERVAADTFMHNPELEVVSGPRFLGGATSADFEIALSQTFELGGKRAKREAVATATARVVGLEAAWTEQIVALRVRRAFALALVARARVAAATESETITVELRDLMTERLDSGAGTQLEVNQATAEASRARRERLTAEQTYEAACLELSSAVGAPADTKLEPTGEFARPEPIAESEDAVVTAGLDARPDLEALDETVAIAEANVRLQDSLKVPDLTVGAAYAHEEDSNLFLVRVSIELPFWNRNQGHREAARVDVNRAKTVAEYGRLELERSIRLAYRRYTSAREAVTAFDAEGLGTLRENLALTREAFERGKLSILEINVLRRTFVDAELAYLDAAVEEVEAYWSLILAVGGDGGAR